MPEALIRVMNLCVLQLCHWTVNYYNQSRTLIGAGTAGE